jgi:pimeloyl-ACP methyl ester carboxylesterase
VRARRFRVVSAIGLIAVAGVIVLLVLVRGGGDQAVRVVPDTGLLDAPLRFEVDGVDAGSLVRLTLSATSGDGVVWTGTSTVRADERGAVEVDGGPLLASLLPTAPRAGDRELGFFVSGDDLELRLEAREASRRLGRARASRRLAADDVTTRDLALAADGLVGRFSRGSSDRGVAVLLLGGSEGGIGSRVEPPLLASHGYPALKLAYFGEEGLPKRLVDIPLEYLVRALEWLRAETGARRVMVIGGSRGAELALILGSRFPELVDGVVAFAPSSVVNPGLSGITQQPSAAWTYGGKPLETVAWTEFGTATPTNRDAIIPVERIRGPVMVVAGVSDMVWPSASYAAAIEERREAFGKETITLVSQDAGHHVGGIPYLPGSPGVDFESARKAGALLRTESWRRLRAMLDELARSRG